MKSKFAVACPALKRVLFSVNGLAEALREAKAEAVARGPRAVPLQIWKLRPGFRPVFLAFVRRRADGLPCVDFKVVE